MSDNLDHHEECYVIPAIDTGMKPVDETEVYCVDHGAYLDDPDGELL